MKVNQPEVAICSHFSPSLKGIDYILLPLVVVRGELLMTEFELKPLEPLTGFAPLCALGYYLTDRKILDPLHQVEIPQKTVDHTPTEKLLDCLVGILAGCSALYQINEKVRPDSALQKAFGRADCAEQSTISDTLDACTPDSVNQTRGVVEEIREKQGKVSLPERSKPPEEINSLEEIWDNYLVIDIDLTGLPASPNAQGSTKGYFPRKRNQTGRQEARISALQYKEVLWKKLYPGNTKSFQVIKEVITELERILGLETREDRAKVLLRLDGGFGTDEIINWLLWRGYQLICKGYSGTRAKKVTSTVVDGEWEEGPTPSQRLGIPQQPHRYGRKTKTMSRQWKDKKGKEHCDLIITTFTGSTKEEMAKLYDSRSGEEAEIKEDKKGLHEDVIRKGSFHGQETLILLTQLAHNILVWSKDWFFRGTKITEFGLVRLIEKVFNIPGEVEIREGKLKRLCLKQSHPLASIVIDGTRQAIGKGRSPPLHPFRLLKVRCIGALRWVGR